MSIRKNLQEREFSGLLFDSMFGLILFFNVESILTIDNPLLLAFYIFTVLIVVHWWLIFKSVFDRFGIEVRNSIVQVVFGLVYIYFVMLIILHTQNFKLHYTTLFLALLFLVDIAWALSLRHIEKWKTKDRKVIKAMEKDLEIVTKVDVVFLAIYAVLYAASGTISQELLMGSIVISYLAYIALTIKLKIISFDYF